MSWLTYGANDSPISSRVTPMTTNAPRNTAAAALMRDQPRFRSAQDVRGERRRDDERDEDRRRHRPEDPGQPDEDEAERDDREHAPGQRREVLEPVGNELPASAGSGRSSSAHPSLPRHPAFHPIGMILGRGGPEGPAGDQRSSSPSSLARATASLRDDAPSLR